MERSLTTLGRRGAALLPLASLLPGRAGAQQASLITPGRDGWLFPAWEDIREPNTAELRQVSDLVADAITMIRGAGIAVAIVLIPMRARIYPEKLPDNFRMASATAERYATLLARWRGAGALMPDLASRFAALRRSQNETVFFSADNHWKPVAAYAAAEEVARLAAPLGLPAVARGGTRLGEWGTLTMRDNDLAGLLPPAEARRYQPERYRVRALPQASGGLLVEDDAANDVAVLGNSFVLPGFGFTPALSQALNRPVTLFVRAGNFGHWRILTEYLGGGLFRANRPKLLVWELLEGDMVHPPEQIGYFGPNTMTPQAFLAGVRAALRAG